MPAGFGQTANVGQASQGWGLSKSVILLCPSLEGRIAQRSSGPQCFWALSHLIEPVPRLPRLSVSAFRLPALRFLRLPAILPLQDWQRAR